MMHMLAYGGAVLATANNQNVPAVVDPVVTTSANNKYICPARVQVVSASALNDLITRARINAPSLRNEGLPEIFPPTKGAAPLAIPLATYWRGVGPTLQQNEEVGLEVSTNVSVTLNASGYILIQDAPKPIPSGKRMRIVGTVTPTLVANAWVSANMVFDQTLPFGNYEVIGLAVVSPGAFVARLIFPRSQVWRPGCPTGVNIGNVDAMQYFLSGRLGALGTFTSVAQPLIEVFGITAGASPTTVILDLVQLSAPATM